MLLNESVLIGAIGGQSSFGCGYAALGSSATICGIGGHVLSTQSVQSVKLASA